jgi:ferredoxin
VDNHRTGEATLDAVAEPSALNSIRIEVDRDLCIGSGDCVDAEPEVFALDDEGKAFVLDRDAATPDEVVDAARNCPVTAIFVIGEDGYIYP